MNNSGRRVRGVTGSGIADLDAGVLERLEGYAATFARDFGVITRTRWAGVYLQGLLLDGERKSIEPLSHRVRTAGWQGDTEQALQQFVNQSPWDHHSILRTYRRLMAAAFAGTFGDDTLSREGGKSIALASMHHDPLLSSGHKPFASFGHVWVVLALLHLINETARHAGHADATRELLDGTTGE